MVATCPNWACSTGSYTVSWGTASGTVAAYQLYEATNSSFSGQYQVYSGLSTSKFINKFNQPGYYWYRVRACNVSGCSGYRSGGPKYAPNQPMFAPGDDASLRDGGMDGKPPDAVRVAEAPDVVADRIAPLASEVELPEALAPVQAAVSAMAYPREPSVPADIRAEQARLSRVAQRLREGHGRGLPTEAELIPAVLRWWSAPGEALAARHGEAQFQLAQAGGTPFRFRVRYEYDAYGHLLRVVNDQDGSEVFWQATAMNAAGQVSGVQYGNGLSSSRLYDAVDRLRTVTGPSPLTVDYDALGNITGKTGVGTYSYSPTRPHQVVSTTGGGSYAYDANGNMTSRNGATLGWTSYNLPSSLSAGGNTASFSYGASRQRFRQVAVSGGVSTETLYVAGGLYERLTTGSAVEHRHYVSAGGEMVAVHVRRSDFSHETRYLHADHLGIVEAITDAQGALLARLKADGDADAGD